MFRAFYKYYRHLAKAIQTLQKLILNYPQSVTRTLNTKWNTEHFREIVHSFCCAYRQLFNFSLQIRFNKLCRRRQFCLECSGQYSVLIKIHIVTGNEKLCKIYFKKLFFQNVLVFIDLFYRSHYPRYFIYSDGMWRHMFTTCNSINFHSLQKKELFSMKSFYCRPCYLLEKIREACFFNKRTDFILHNN